MMSGISRTVTAALLAATALVPASQAVAGGFGNRLQSSIGAGAAFAGAGTAPYGLSGMFWNPASVNLADGFMYESSWTLVLPQSDLTATSRGPLLVGLPGTSGDIGIDALVPGSYGAYRFNDSIALGFSINAPFGLSTKPNLPWAGQNYAITSKAAVIDAAAVFGYTFNDWISIGVGPRLIYGTAKFSRDLVPDGFIPGIQWAILDDLEDWGFGWEAGVTLKPWAGTEIGLGYRSRVDLSLEGSLSLPGGLPAPPFPPGGSYPVTGDVTLPDQLTLSVAQKISPQWTLLGSVEWKNWSVVQDVAFVSPGVGEMTALTFRYKDGWNFALGAEYQYNDDLTLRGGVSYEVSPVQDQYRDVSIPDSDRIWVSAGLSYDITERWKVDVGYSHAFAKSATVDYGPQNPDTIPGAELVADVDSSIDVISVGFRYKFGGTAVAAMPETSLVTK